MLDKGIIEERKEVEELVAVEEDPNQVIYTIIRKHYQGMPAENLLTDKVIEYLENHKDEINRELMADLYQLCGAMLPDTLLSRV